MVREVKVNGYREVKVNGQGGQSEWLGRSK